MMPAILKGALYLVGLYGFGSLAYEAGKKKGVRDRSTAVEGVPSLPACDPYLTLPTGHPGLVRIVRPRDPEWCVALGYHLQLAACARSRAVASFGSLLNV
jgi:hypothetical protein